MSKSIINLNTGYDFREQPLFFGDEGLALQRYDQAKYPPLLELFKKQLGFYWRPEEIPGGGKDRSDYDSLTEHERFIFTKNLGYQILLDSVQSRGISNLLENCTNPEFESFAKSWEFMETVHSYSYTHIIKNIYNDPSSVLDNVLKDDEIVKRATSVTKYYDDLINSLDDSLDEDGNYVNLYEAKKKLYLTLVSINILEGIRFYVSFACSYSFAQNKKMEANAKIIKLINRDENLHLGCTQFIIKKLREEASEGFQDIVIDCEKIVIDMFRDAATEEMEWAEYLFQNGSMLGLNEQILKEYMKWLTNHRMKSIGLEPIFEKINNPIGWIKNWTESKDVQVAPQEAEIVSYTVGNFEQDMDDNEFEDFEL